MITVSELETEANPHPCELRTVHTGDLIRVSTEEQVLDRGAAIAVWPYYQADFDDGNHVDDLFIEERRRKDHTVENPTWETVQNPIARGVRVTIATEDGGRYAVVDWAKNQDPPVLYVLVIDSPDPDGRRWSRIGDVTGVERYGPEPEDRAPDWFGNTPSEDVEPWIVEQNAEPDFSAPGDTDGN